MRASSEEASSPTSRVRRVLDWFPVLVAAATAATLLLAVIVNVVGLCLVRHPAIGYPDNILVDAEAVATGHFQYGNPATHFVGFPYTPIFSWLVAGLLKIDWWPGWPPLVSMLAALLSLGALIRLVWTRAHGRLARLATASFIVAFTLGALSVPLPSFQEGRPDQLAWCFLVLGGALVFGDLALGARPTITKMVGTGLLLALSVATKQPTLVPCLVVALVAFAGPHLIASGRGWELRAWLRSATVPATMVAGLVALGVGLQVASQGYAADLLVGLPLRYGRSSSLGHVIRVSVQTLWVPMIIFVALTVAAVWTSRRSTGETSSERRERVLLWAAVVVGVSPLPTAIWAVAKLGGERNQLMGPIWTMALACAVVLLVHPPHRRAALAAAAACVVLVVSIQPVSALLSPASGRPTLYKTTAWSSIDPWLLAQASNGHVVYDIFAPSLSVTPSESQFPPEDFQDLWAGGYTPRLFIDNLLAGRYALVSPVLQWEPHYDSDLLRFDDSVPWKLNMLLQMGYARVAEPHSRFVFYRPTSKLTHMGWFATCFGPYQAQRAGVEVRIAGHGGLTCINQGSLRLSQAYYPTDFVATLTPGGGMLEVRFDGLPQVLQIDPLDGHDNARGPAYNGKEAGSVVERCIVRTGTEFALAIRAVGDIRHTRCTITDGRSVLDVPASGSTEAHVRLQVSAVNTPTITALSQDGIQAPFRLLNPTPSTIRNL